MVHRQEPYETPPQLTDTEGAIQEARRLNEVVNLPDLMIKVVATNDGVAAVEALTASGAISPST